MPRNAVPLYKEFINFCKQLTNMAASKIYDVLASLLMHYFRII